MVIFRKKKDHSLDEDERSLIKKTGKKDFSPTSSEKRRRKKEPFKPWGKRDRVFVFVVLLISVTTSAILAASSRSWKLPGLPKISFDTFRNKTIVIEGDRKSIERQKKAEEAIATFKEKTKELSGVYSLYVVDLESGFFFGVLEFEKFEPASLNKLPAMLAIYKESERGNIDLETDYKLKSTDKVAGSGSLSSKPAGTVVPYRELVSLMGKQSDNTAFKIVKNILGEEVINDVIKELGMKDTVIFGEDQRTTASDTGLLFQKLMEGFLTSESRNQILDSLTDTIYEAWITEGIPDELKVAHKFGRETHIVNDAGVIFADEPFVLVILSKGVVEHEADIVFPELARIVYESIARE